MNWRLKEKAPKEFLEKFPQYSPLVLQLLYDRELKTQVLIDEFFNPDYESDLHDPFLMKGVKEAVKEIKKAIKKQKKIIIYGDYDADGICSSVILLETLKKLGAKNIDVYIPDRSREGYGLNKEAVKKLAEKGIQLIITVDCGITDFEEIELAKKSGMETIVVDHHRVLEKIPKAKVVIDPHQAGDKYPFKELAAVGVVFKLISALIKDEKEIEEGFSKWFLDLVALATVADMMPLLGENRTLVKYGLVVLAQTKRIGLKELMKVSRITDYNLEVIDNGNGQIEHKVNGLDSWTFAFALAPRINVAARLESADAAYRLLITESEDEGKKIALQLEKLNRQRQQSVEKIVKEIEARLSSKELPIVIFEADKNWPRGLVGLVASKISEKYFRPAFIFNINENKYNGSARSVKGFNLVEAISQAADLLEEFGGHPAAAGLTVLKKNFEKSKERISVHAEKKLKNLDLTPQIEIDVQLDLDQIAWSNYDQVQSFAPFGKLNPEPLFLTKGLEIVDLRLVGNNNKHLKLELFGPIKQGKQQMKKVKAIGFCLAEKCPDLKKGDLVDLVYEFIIDQWNGTRDLQLKIVDIKKVV